MKNNKHKLRKLIETNKIYVERINDNIVHVIANNQQTLASGLMRAQERYENAEFKDKVFTVGEYKDWYRENHGGYTFPDCIDGYNIPYSYFDEFLKGKFDPLTEEERKIIDYIGFREDLYLIGTYLDGDSSTYEHELCHALYGTDEKYKAGVHKIYNKYKDELQHVTRFLQNSDYDVTDDKILIDETHAFVGADYMYLAELQIDYPFKMTQDLQKLKAKYLPTPTYLKYLELEDE